MSDQLKSLRSLAEILSREVVAELLQIFERQYSTTSVKMLELLSERDFKNAGFMAHTMKSSAANMGATELASLYREIEYSPEKNLSLDTIKKIDERYLFFRAIADEWLRSG